MKKKMFFAFILLFSCFVNANTDSLKQVLINQSESEKLSTILILTKLYSYTELQETALWSTEGIKLATKLKDKVAESQLYSNLADAYYYQYDLDKALENYSHSFDIADNISNDTLKANAYNNIGILYYMWGNLNRAETYFLRAYDYSTQAEDYNGMANSMNNLGNIMLDKGLSDSAMYYYDKVYFLKMQSDNKIDVANCLNNIGTVIESKGDNNKALLYFEKALNIARETQDARSIASSLTNIGLIYQNWGKYEKALSYFQEALLMCEKTDDIGSQAKIYNNIGLIYNHIGDYKIALRNYQKAIELQRDINDISGLASSYFNIGVLLENIGEYEKALDYYAQSLKIKEQLQDTRGIANIYTSMGNAYGSLEKIDKAMNYYEKALQINLKLDDQEGIAQLYQNLGALMDYTGRADEAIEFYEKSLNIEQRLNNTEGIALSLQNIGSNYKNRNQFSKALEYYKRCEAIAKESNLRVILMNNNKFISELYMLSNNYKGALDYYIDYTSLKDTLFSEEEKKQINEIQTRYETEVKEREIELLRKDNELSKAKTDQQNLLIYSLVIGIVLIILMLTLAINRYIVKNRANNMLAERNAQIEYQKKEITDSIESACRIQKAILPQAEYLNQVLGNSFFILYKPRDIVSGDFYWINQIGNKKIVVVADCTGHGVPGAFMSMLGVSILNEIVNIEGVTQAHEILNNMRTRIIGLLHQQHDKDVKEGMDMSLICIDEQQQKIQYSGAHNSLMLVRNNELIEVKADKMPVAIYYKMDNFTSQNIDVQKGDMIYLASDGYQDQMGGKDNKKFMKKRFKKLLVDISSNELEEQKNILDNTIEHWKQDTEQIDDIVVMGIRI